MTHWNEWTCDGVRRRSGHADDNSFHVEVFQPDGIMPRCSVEVCEPEDATYGTRKSTIIARDLERRDAAQLAGLLLLSPMYASARLIPNPPTGKWVPETQPETTPL